MCLTFSIQVLDVAGRNLWSSLFFLNYIKTLTNFRPKKPSQKQFFTVLHVLATIPSPAGGRAWSHWITNNQTPEEEAALPQKMKSLAPCLNCLLRSVGESCSLLHTWDLHPVWMEVNGAWIVILKSHLL